MHNRLPISIAVAAVFAAPTFSLAAEFGGVEVTTHLKNETSVFISDGQKTGEASSLLDDSGHDAGDLLKFENSAKIFFNGDIGENASWHGELNLIYDTEGVNSDYKGHRNYTQHDYLRELYADTSISDWDLRLGKQQVVWGTADGIKLLDIINPTDFRELNQNTFEDSRIPVWMINAERNIGERGNVQLIVSQIEENKIPGLNSDGDRGHPFIFKGVDTITGSVNGFLNIAPALGRVSNSFHNFAFGGAFTGGAPNPAGLAPFTNLSVDGFASQNWNVVVGGGGALLSPTGTPVVSTTGSADNPLLGGSGTYEGYRLLNTIANDANVAGPNANEYVTNLTNISVSGGVADTVTWAPDTARATFDYMPNATFSTFNTFGGNLGTGGTIGSINTDYKRDYPDDFNANAGFRFRSYTDAGLNYSLNYFYHYDANPAVEIGWHDASSGEQLITELRNPGAGGLPTGALVNRDNVPQSFAPDGSNSVTVLLRNEAGQYYGAANPTTGATGDATHSTNGAVARFTESLNRIHSLGASFDYAMDTAFAPVVLRGEFLYQRDTLQPVVDKRLLAIGDLEGSLRMEEADMFKYVLGVDVTVLTNLLVSGQFIQFRNLDFEDQERGCTTQFGVGFDCSRYTADFASLHIDNGLNKGYKNKEFYSLFFSKPFGEAQLGRWNNITIYEDGDGWWNRFDVEYSFSDQLIVSGELNLYWGDQNTTFGQFADSSNVQLGIKYIIE